MRGSISDLFVATLAMALISSSSARAEDGSLTAYGIVRLTAAGDHTCEVTYRNKESGRFLSFDEKDLKRKQIGMRCIEFIQQAGYVYDKYTHWYRTLYPEEGYFVEKGKNGGYEHYWRIESHDRLRCLRD